MGGVSGRRLRGHIRLEIHQLRLRVSQIAKNEERSASERELMELVQKDYYYGKLLPLITSDAVRHVYLEHRKRVLQNGVMTDVLEVGRVEGAFCSVRRRRF